MLFVIPSYFINSIHTAVQNQTKAVVISMQLNQMQEILNSLHLLEQVTVAYFSSL